MKKDIFHCVSEAFREPDPPAATLGATSSSAVANNYLKKWRFCLER